VEMARARGKVRGRDGWYMLSAFDRCGAGRGAWVHLRRRVSAANTAGYWVGGELRPVYSSPGGDKDHERSEYRCILERQEFVAGVERQRNGG